MCLAVPVKIKKITNDTAVVDADGIEREASLMLMSDAKVGDYVLLHAGFAIQKIDEKEAVESLKIWKEMKSLT